GREDGSPKRGLRSTIAKVVSNPVTELSHAALKGVSRPALGRIWDAANDLRHDSFGLAEHRGTHSLGDHAGCGAHDVGRPSAGGPAGRTDRTCDNLPGAGRVHRDRARRGAGVRPGIKKTPPGGDAHHSIQCDWEEL